MSKALNITRYFMAYLFIGLAIGSYFPILTAYLKSDLKNTPIQISTLMAIITIVPIFTLPIWGIITDTIKSPKRSLIVALIFSAILIFLLAFIRTYLLFFLVITIFMIFRAPIFALFDEILINVSKNEKVNYGTIRSGGSLGFAISAFIGSYFAQRYGHSSVIFILSGIYFLIVILFIFTCEDVHYKDKEKINIKNDMPILFKNKYFLIICLLIGITYGVNDTNLPYISTYLQQIANSDRYTSLAIFLSVFIEFPMLYLTKYIYRIVSIKQIFLFINIINVIRYSLFFLFPTTATILLLAAFHGLTYSLSYPIVIQYTSENVRKKVLATSYALLSAIVAIITASITYITGFILNSSIHFQNIFIFFIFMHTINVILILVLLKNYVYKAKTL